MNRDQIMNMPAGREMDALVAENVFGYTVHHESMTTNGEQPDGKFHAGISVPFYSVDWNAASLVADHFTRNGWCLSASIHGDSNCMYDGTTAVFLVGHGRDGFAAETGNKNLPLAICRSALLAACSPTTGTGISVDPSQLWSITEPGEIIPSPNVQLMKEQLDAALAERDQWHEAYDRLADQLAQLVASNQEWLELSKHLLVGDNSGEIERINCELQGKLHSLRMACAVLQKARQALEAHLRQCDKCGRIVREPCEEHNELWRLLWIAEKEYSQAIKGWETWLP